MKHAKHIILVFAVTVALAASASGQVQVSAQVDSGKDIYVGEGFNFYIVIQGSNKAGKVDLQPLQQYNPQSAGNRTQSSTNIVGNKVTTATTMIMTYTLTVNQTGMVQLPPVTVQVDGKTYRTNPVTATITKPGTTNQLDLEMALSEQQCFVGQPVLLTIKFYYYTKTENPQFDIPVLGSDAFYFENPDVWGQQVQEADLGNETTVLVSQHQEMRNGRQSNLIILRKILIPRSSGPMLIEPTTANANVAVGRSNSFFGQQFRYKRFMVKSQPAELTVLPLPDEDKPAQFYGLVGQYTIDASATPTDVSVGDPITLTIKIGGGMYLKPVRWPALEQVPEMAANFKIPSQKASPTIAGGVKVFTQTVRANNDKVTEIPSIPLAYFDATKGKYTIVRTEPIKLEVAPTKILTNADLEGSDFAPMNREIEAIRKGLSANYEALETLDDMSFSPLAALGSPGYAVLWAVPLLGLVSSFMVKILSHTSPEKAAARRRRQACGKALAQLKKLASTDVKQQNEQLVSIMKNYIGEKFDKTAGSLTPDECYDAIIAATQDSQSADKYKAAGRYALPKGRLTARSEIKIDSDKVRKVSELVRSIEKNCSPSTSLRVKGFFMPPQDTLRRSEDKA